MGHGMLQAQESLLGNSLLTKDIFTFYHFLELGSTHGQAYPH